jgi:hypothetical protein
MFHRLWTRQLDRWLLLTPSLRAQAKPRRRAATRPYRPILEKLELRLVPTTQTFNPGDTAALIQDLQAASNSPSVTTIINLQPNTTYTLTAVNNFWYGPDGLPPIDSHVIIHGNGATIQCSGTAPFRLFYVSGGMELPAGSLMMDKVTLKGGVAKGGDSLGGGGGLGAGGAIFNQGTLNLTDVTLTNNEAAGGGGGVGGFGNGGGGMGGDADSAGDGGGFGGSLSGTFGGLGGKGGGSGVFPGGGGGFLTGANGGNGTSTNVGAGGGLGGFGSSGDGGSGKVASNLH